MKNKETKECETCKSSGLKPSQYSVIGFSILILGTSIYGTIKLISLIVNHFSH